MDLRLFLLVANINVFSCQWISGDRCYYDQMRPEVKFACFNLNSPFTNSLGHYPKSPSDQGLSFRLFTPSNPITPQVLNALDASSVSASNFNASGKVVFAVHGFTMSSSHYTFVAMTAQLLSVVSNVVLVDWEQGAKGPNYYQATANTRVVGSQLAALILTMETVGLSRSNVHIVGFSLGAQIAGYAGRLIRSPLLGRITGLDPAGPNFEGYHNDVKLDSSDALFVDVIHTNAKPLILGGFGTADISGHVDFFPNGGKEQPGCGPSLLLWTNLFEIQTLDDIVACSHMKAPKFFTASINDNNFTAYHTLCSPACEGDPNKMGYHATPNPSGSFFLNTGANYPF